ncbi:MAG: hypothetical protein HQL26_04310 [Candidatus Omnitrophica bacterium]|nr:hypothetical protein [Candidatus Omnitrophota bacterium]
MSQFRFSFWTKLVCSFLSVIFALQCVYPLQAAKADVLTLPAPGSMVSMSPAFVPTLLRGMTVHPDNPLRFDFILDKGEAESQGHKDTRSQREIRIETEKLVNYFLASMTVPEKDLWVNLSPNEPNRIVSKDLGKTEMGRDLLAQDYILKQLTASLMQPDGEAGRELWSRIYERAKKELNTTDIPLDTFNKVWILPESATIYEHNNTVYITDAKLKVMTDSDYNTSFKQTVIPAKAGIQLTSLIKKIIIPEIEKEVNTGKNFAQLRQIYYSLILAKWYKDVVRNSLLEKVYIGKNKVDGLDLNPNQTLSPANIYKQYMSAFKQGVYNKIKEEYDPQTQQIIARKYFSGGFQDTAMTIKQADAAQITQAQEGEQSSVAVTLDNISVSQEPEITEKNLNDSERIIYNKIQFPVSPALIREIKKSKKLAETFCLITGMEKNDSLLAQFLLFHLFIRMSKAEEGAVANEFYSSAGLLNPSYQERLPDELRKDPLKVLNDFLTETGREELRAKNFENWDDFKDYLLKTDQEPLWEIFQEWVAALPYRKFFELAHIEKAAQFLSTRPDMVPEGFRESFEVFQDRGKPAPIEEIVSVVEDNYGPLENLCEKRQDIKEGDNPYLKRLNVGTVADTFLVTLKNGQQEAWKIVAPSKEAKIRQGLETLREVMGELEKNKVFFAGNETIRLSPVRFFKEFEKAVLRELDMNTEAKQARDMIPHFPKGFAKPEIRESKKQILRMGFINGTKITLVTDTEIRKRLAKKILPLIGLQALGDEIFHADPHPGNIFYIEETGEIVLFDFGQVGYLTKSVRRDLVNLAVQILQHREQRGLHQVMYHAIGKILQSKIAAKMARWGLFNYYWYQEQKNQKRPQSSPDSIRKTENRQKDHESEISFESTLDFDDVLKKMVETTPLNIDEILDFLELKGIQNTGYNRDSLHAKISEILTSKSIQGWKEQQPYIMVDRLVYEAEALGLIIQTPYSSIISHIMTFAHKYADMDDNIEADEIGFKTEVSSILRFRREGESIFPVVHRIFLAADRFGYPILSSASMLIKSLLLAEGVQRTLKQNLEGRNDSNDSAMTIKHADAAQITRAQVGEQSRGKVTLSDHAMQQIILPDYAGNLDPLALGEKPRKVIELMRKGLNVPKFFVIKSNGTGKLEITDELRRVFDSFKKPVIVRSAHPMEGGEHPFPGIFNSYSAVSYLAFEDIPDGIRPDAEGKWDKDPLSVDWAYEDMVETASPDWNDKLDKYLKANAIKDFDPKAMDAVLMEQVDVEVFGMFFTESQIHPNKIEIRYIIPDTNDGGIILFDKTTQSLEENSLPQRIQEVLTEFGKTAQKIHDIYGFQQIELASSKIDKKVYVFQSRNFPIGDPNNVARYPEYQTIMTPNAVLGYGDYNLPVIVLDGLDSVTKYKEDPKYRALSE